jgi:hypothetical protein
LLIFSTGVISRARIFVSGLFSSSQGNFASPFYQ